MEIKTANDIIEEMQQCDDGCIITDGTHYNSKWVSIDDIIQFSNNWFDKKRKNNEMWRLNQDELSSLFLEELENELKKEE